MSLKPRDYLAPFGRIDQIMLVRAQGFQIDLDKYPAIMDIGEIFDGINSFGVGALDTKGRYFLAVSENDHLFQKVKKVWKVGAMIRFRDAKTFNKAKSINGKLVMSSDQLLDGNIAETTYFIINPDTGKGLIASYFGSPNLKMLQWGFQKAFKVRQAGLRKAAVENAVSNKEKLKAAKDFAGKVSLLPLLRKGSVKELLKNFRKVESVEVKLSSVSVRQRLLGKPEAKTVTRVEKYTFVPEFTFLEHDDAIEELLKSVGDEDEFIVKGQARSGYENVISSVENKNKQLFGSADYDKLHGEGFQLEHSMEETNIGKSPVLEWLMRILNDNQVQMILTAT